MTKPNCHRELIVRDVFAQVNVLLNEGGPTTARTEAGGAPLPVMTEGPRCMMSTGIPNLDAEHKWIVDAIDGLRPVISSASDMTMAQRITCVVVDAFISHRLNEERIAAEEGVDRDSLSKLNQMHIIICAQLSEFRTDLGQKIFCSQSLLEIADKLELVMINHFIEIDRPLISRRSAIVSGVKATLRK